MDDTKTESHKREFAKSESHRVNEHNRVVSVSLHKAADSTVTSGTNWTKLMFWRSVDPRSTPYPQSGFAPNKSMPMLGTPAYRAFRAVRVKPALRDAPRSFLQLWTVSKVPACVDAPL